MGNQNIKYSKIIVVLIIIVVVLLSMYYITRPRYSSVQYDEEIDYYGVWFCNHTIIDSEVTLFISYWTEWNESFYLSNYSHNTGWLPDFNNYSYAFLDWGAKPTTGYSIEFTDILYKGGDVIFHYNKTEPENGGMAIVTYPQQMVKISHSVLDVNKIDSYSFVLDAE